MARKKYIKKKPNWGRTRRARDNMAWALWRIRKKHRDYDGVLLPPVSDELLIWLKGISTDTQKTDSWAEPDAENFDIKQSNCIALNGTDEYGTLDTPITLSDGFEISFESTVISAGVLLRHSTALTAYININGLSTLAVKFGVYAAWTGVDYTKSVKIVRTGSFAELFVGEVSLGVRECGADDFSFDVVGNYSTGYGGKLYNLTLKDSTQEHHFRIAEGNGSEFSWSDDKSRYITWDGSLDEMWAQRQNSYHSNAELGYWTSDPPDGIYYPCNPDLI